MGGLLSKLTHRGGEWVQIFFVQQDEFKSLPNEFLRKIFPSVSMLLMGIFLDLTQYFYLTPVKI